MRRFVGNCVIGAGYVVVATAIILKTAWILSIILMCAFYGYSMHPNWVGYVGGALLCPVAFWLVPLLIWHSAGAAIGIGMLAIVYAPYFVVSLLLGLGVNLVAAGKSWNLSQAWYPAAHAHEEAQQTAEAQERARAVDREV
jgi:hypothetical protein